MAAEGRAMSQHELSTPILPARAQLALGLCLVFAPVAALVGIHAMSSSAAIAAGSALSLSTTLQLAAERLWPARALPPRSRRLLATEIFQGVVYGTFLAVGTIFGIAWLVARVKAILGIELVLHGPIWLQALALVAASDFLDYFRHRHEHESTGLFWRVHSVHHSIRHFSLLDGLALHPLEAVFTFVSYGLVSGLLGFRFEVMVLGFTLAMIAMGAQHTNAPTRLGLLSNVLAHADGHRWHHDIALSSGRNVNYANVFSFWDRLWGSFRPATPFEGEYGIEPFRDTYPVDLAGQARMAFAADYARAESTATSRRIAVSRASPSA